VGLPGQFVKPFVTHLVVSKKRACIPLPGVTHQKSAAASSLVLSFRPQRRRNFKSGASTLLSNVGHSKQDIHQHLC
jgi:hypothetical protein